MLEPDVLFALTSPAQTETRLGTQNQAVNITLIRSSTLHWL